VRPADALRDALAAKADLDQLRAGDHTVLNIGEARERAIQRNRLRSCLLSRH
jgi:hypothetical protein